MQTGRQCEPQKPPKYIKLPTHRYRGVGRGLAVVGVGRGAAFGDIFNDGKVDVVINNMDGVPFLLRNVVPDRHHWVEV